MTGILVVYSGVFFWYKATMIVASEDVTSSEYLSRTANYLILLLTGNQDSTGNTNNYFPLRL